MKKNKCQIEKKTNVIMRYFLFFFLLLSFNFNNSDTEKRQLKLYIKRTRQKKI